MKSRIFTLLMLAIFSLTANTQLNGQCNNMVGLIGEFTGWTSDLVMDRDPEDPEIFTAFVTLTEEHDTDTSGMIEVKFRHVGDWGTNWGDPAFPSGTGTPGGDNILATAGTYFVSFNCATGDYSFIPTCADLGLIGEMTGWTSDIPMTRSFDNPNMFSTIITLTAEHDTDTSGTVEVKFRKLGDWGTNWGDPAFPSGTGTPDGENIQALPGSYLVTFDCSTGNYTFDATCADLGLIGEMTAWADDIPMTRSFDNPNIFSTIITLTAEHDADTSGMVELKFRKLGDWGTNWGDDDFPSGTGAADGANIPAEFGTYLVTFDCSTGDYSFVTTCGEVGMIGEFNNWNGDFPMVRDLFDPNLWTAIKSLSTAHDGDSDGDIEVKFRQDADWTVNWGNPAFPSGTATIGGDNIIGMAGTYDVTFNCATGAYSFLEASDICGDIGMIGDFNAWGVGDDNVVTDVTLVRDPDYPSQFSLDYTFTSGTKLLFRENADQAFVEVWGGVAFPIGTAVQDGGTTQLDVPGGNYNITFNCLSGDYNFTRLGSSVAAPKVFAIEVDGNLDEADWKFSDPVTRIVSGEAGDDPLSATFATAYNADELYVAIKVVDGIIAPFSATPLDNDGIIIFIDGNKNGGDFDASDLALVVFTSGATIVLEGPDGIDPTAKVSLTDNGYQVEVGIPWSDLGITPVEGAQIGFDFSVVDAEDSGFTSSIAWNGNASNLDQTSAFGDLIFGTLACGNISLYNDMIGDVSLQTPTETPNTYVTTYEFESAMDLVFRKDNSSVVTWGDAAFPGGTATVGGNAIAATAGRYRVSFSCLDGVYSFTEEAAGDDVASVPFTSSAVTIDGDLSEFSLDFGMDAGVVVGAGPDNNTVTWGALWDAGNLYIGAHVIDATVEGSGNPWDNDAIEMYFDGNHDADGAFDADFDTQVILDAMGGSTLWIKADGVPITDYESNFTLTDDGYNIELRLAWSNFGFAAARNRTMGFSMANNDSDNGIGRDYQTAWAGTADNWNNTMVHGDLQLAGGDLVDTEYPSFYNNSLTLFPNPASITGAFLISSDGEVFTGKAQMTMFNLLGQSVIRNDVDFTGGTIRIENANLTPGTYFVHLLSEDGKQAVKKVVLR